MGEEVKKVKRPSRCDGEDIYSNFSHELEKETLERIKESGDFAQHSAWNFCGYIWFADGRWVAFDERDAWLGGKPVGGA